MRQGDARLTDATVGGRLGVRRGRRRPPERVEWRTSARHHSHDQLSVLDVASVTGNVRRRAEGGHLRWRLGGSSRRNRPNRDAARIGDARCVRGKVRRARDRRRARLDHGNSNRVVAEIDLTTVGIGARLAQVAVQPARWAWPGWGTHCVRVLGRDSDMGVRASVGASPKDGHHRQTKCNLPNHAGLVSRFQSRPHGPSCCFDGSRLPRSSQSLRQADSVLCKNGRRHVDGRFHQQATDVLQEEHILAKEKRSVLP